jgi:hypothetical protein
VSRYIQAGAQATVAEVGFDSLEWLLKQCACGTDPQTREETMGALARPRRRSARRSLRTGAGSVALAAAKQFTPRTVEVSAFASLRKNFLRVATAMQEAGMQHGSLIRSGRKRGPRCLAVPLCGQRAVWQTHLSQKGDWHSLPISRSGFCQSVTVLLREINRHALQRCSLPMTVAEVCDHFVQRELTKNV